MGRCGSGRSDRPTRSRSCPNTAAEAANCRRSRIASPPSSSPIAPARLPAALALTRSRARRPSGVGGSGGDDQTTYTWRLPGHPPVRIHPHDHIVVMVRGPWGVSCLRCLAAGETRVRLELICQPGTRREQGTTERLAWTYARADIGLVGSVSDCELAAIKVAEATVGPGVELRVDEAEMSPRPTSVTAPIALPLLLVPFLRATLGLLGPALAARSLVAHEASPVTMERLTGPL